MTPASNVSGFQGATGRPRPGHLTEIQTPPQFLGFVIPIILPLPIESINRVLKLRRHVSLKDLRERRVLRNKSHSRQLGGRGLFGVSSFLLGLPSIMVRDFLTVAMALSSPITAPWPQTHAV